VAAERLDVDEGLANELATELALVREAAFLVARGVSARVIVANIVHGRIILFAAQEIGTAMGVRVSALGTSDPSRLDISLECLKPIPRAESRVVPSSSRSRTVRAVSA
jgi:hypothetical protein